MLLILVISTLAVVNARPQQTANEPKPDELVQIEKQDIRELKPSPQPKTLLHDEEETQRALKTQEILQKILETNKKHGLTPKGLKTDQDYIQIPVIQRSGLAKQQNFQFPQTPFSNPIFDYLNGNTQNQELRQSTPDLNNKPTAYVYTTNDNAEVRPEDQIPGQYVKRKVTHQQTFIIPSSMGNSLPNNFGQLPNYFNQVPYYYGTPNYPNQPQMQPQYETDQSELEGVKKKLENSTIENVKNIVNTQLPNFNPYVQNQLLPYVVQAPLPSHPYGVPYAYSNLPGYGSNQPFSSSRPSRQWQWPFAQYFPIVIKDPFQQIFNAFTSMIEYGPSQNADALCADDQKKSDNQIARSGKTLAMENTYEDEINTNKPVTMDIEDLQMGNNNENSMKFTLKFEATTDLDERSLKEYKTESPRLNNKLSHFTQPQATQTEDKGLFFNKKKDKIKEETQSNDENVKLFSKDNTGSGVFIHKLKVRRGGVAIAGPGGIATAGSGGTAIVGPNGYAYTQPDSLAIAGSGTKVIAVDPSINFSELISGKNKTEITPRLGKVVAVGPVVYYNKG